MSIIERELDETQREIAALPEIPEPKTREQILRDAAEIVEAVGYQYSTAGMLHPLEHGAGGVCILGAIARAADTGLYIDDDGLVMYDMSPPAQILLGVDADRLAIDANRLAAAAYRWSDWLRYKHKKTRWIFGRTIPPAERIASCLRLVADGVPFDEATWLS